MLQFFHRFQKHALFIVLLLAIIMAMSGFGLNFGRGGSSSSQAAIKVNEIEISRDQVREAIKSTEYRYRQMFGKSYDQFAKQLAQNLPQQVTDDLIDQSVMLSHARKLGLVGGKEGIKQVIRHNFPNDPNFALYQAYLAQINKTPAQFEANLADDVIRTQLQQLIKDSVNPSKREVDSAVIRLNTSYSVSYVEFDPQTEAAKATEPTEDQVKRYYEDHAAEYELEPRVNYRYVLFNSEDYRKAVAVDPDTIAIEYDEHKGRYKAPEEYKVRHIQFNYSAKSDAKQMAEISQKAKRALDRIKAGESFEKIAEEYTDDITTRSLAGELGWIKAGHIGPEFDEALIKLKKGEMSEVVAADYGFHIIKLEDKREARQLTLDEVKDKIEQEIREREAPAYTAENAHVLLEEWRKSNSNLEEFARNKSFTILDSKGLLTKENDPDASVAGLTAKVLGIAGDQKTLALEIGKNAALVEVSERRGTEIPPLDAVKNTIVEKLKLESAKVIAKQNAEKLLNESAEKSLVELAKSKGLASHTSDYSPDKSASGVLGLPEIGRAISAVKTPQTTLAEVFQSGSKFVVLQVSTIKVPKLEDLKEQLKQANTQQQQASADLLLDSMLAGLKAKAEIKNTL